MTVAKDNPRNPVFWLSMSKDLDAICAQHWQRIRDDLEAKRQALRDQGYVVCSSQLYFEPGTKLGWRAACEAEASKTQSENPSSLT